MPKPVKFRAIFLLRCPYCLVSPLRAPGSWFTFNEGCPSCHYRYDREEGYFIGAPWMISYPVIGIICVLSSVLLYSWLMPIVGIIGLAAIIASLAIVSGLLFYPYARAIWMTGDHFLHPLSEQERSYRSPL